MTTTNDAPAPSGSGVRVKPLTWNEYETEGAVDRWDARCCMGSYYEIGINLRGFIVSHDYENLSGAHETIDAAKAAAQADYEARILSALASDASSRGEAVAWRWRFHDDKPSTPWSFTAKIEDVMGLDIQSQPLYAHPAPATVESGWLIELKGTAPSWAILNPQDYDEHWTTDSTRAIRFAREVDAQAYIDHIGWTEAFPSEHIWDDGRRAALASATEGRKG